MTTKRMALGKGLGAMIPELDQEGTKTLLFCGIEEIIPNRSQPRKHFDELKLEELRNLGVPELAKELETSHRELFDLRFRLSTRQLVNHREVPKVKRRIATLNTIIKEKELGLR